MTSLTDYEVPDIDAIAKAWWDMPGTKSLIPVGRSLGVPAKQVYAAVLTVGDEADALLSLYLAGDIDPVQLQRLAVLVDLFPGWVPAPIAQAVRTAAQTPPGPVHQQSGGGALPRGTSQSSE